MFWLLSVAVLAIDAANRSVMSTPRHTKPWLPNMPDPMLLILRWRSVSWWGNVWRYALFQLKRLPRLCLWIITTLQHWYSPRSNTNDPWHCIDCNIQVGTGSMSAILWIWKAANTAFMNGWNQSLLSFATEGCRYVGYW
jgi:hypothetical protein